MTQEQKIKKLGKVMSKYFTDVKVGFDFWNMDEGLGVFINVGKSKVEIIPDENTDEVSILFFEKGRVYPCDEVVKTKEYDFFGEYLFKALVPQK